MRASKLISDYKNGKDLSETLEIIISEMINEVFCSDKSKLTTSVSNQKRTFIKLVKQINSEIPDLVSLKSFDNFVELLYVRWYVNNVLCRTKIDSIILGLFDNPYFDKIKKETKSLSFFEFCTVLENQDFEVKSVKESVYNAMICCKKIVFLLDMITKPLSEESITCWELRTVLNQEKFFNKTIFYKEGQIIKNQDVYETYNEY